MTAPAPGFPSGRDLAGLWRQVQHSDAAACWICHLLLHRIEAPVLVRGLASRPPLELAALRALAACQPATVAVLDQRLALGSALVRRLLGRLREDQLVRTESGESLCLTAAGRQLAEGQQGPAAAFERAVFHFVQRPDGAAAFVHLRQSATPLPVAPPGWSFNPQHLLACADRPADWKVRHQFPENLAQVLTLHSDLSGLTPDVPAWQLVLLDQAEQLTLLAVVEEGTLRGYILDQSSGTLSSTEPALVLGDRSVLAEVFGSMLQEPETESWQLAWKEWCSGHGIPLAEAAGIRFVPRGAVLQVTGHPLRPERLRSLAADPTQPEPWLLAGSGPCRCAARIEFAAPRGR